MNVVKKEENPRPLPGYDKCVICSDPDPKSLVYIKEFDNFVCTTCEQHADKADGIVELVRLIKYDDLVQPGRSTNPE